MTNFSNMCFTLTKNFQILTDIPADTGNSSNSGYNNVTLVNSDYIDYIMTRVFRITPEKPPVNELWNAVSVTMTVTIIISAVSVFILRSKIS